MGYESKYLKYKQKYNDLKKKLYGGVISQTEYGKLSEEDKFKYRFDARSSSEHGEKHYELKTPEELLKKIVSDEEYYSLPIIDRQKYRFDDESSTLARNYYKLKTPEERRQPQVLEKFITAIHYYALPIREREKYKFDTNSPIVRYKLMTPEELVEANKKREKARKERDEELKYKKGWSDIF